MKAVVLSQITDEYMHAIEKVCEVVKAGACKAEPELNEKEVSVLVKQHNPEILIVDSTPITAGVLQNAENLKIVICTRGNPVNVDKSILDERNIPLTSTPARNANGVAEFTLGLILACMRKILQSDSAIRNGAVSLNKSAESIKRDQNDVIWYHPELEVVPYEEFKGKELTSSTLGLVGVGSVGKLVAEKANLLGMEVIAFDPYIPAHIAVQLPIDFYTLEEIAERSDVVSIHAKATTENQHLIDKEFFQIMKPGASLINTSRGSLLNTGDLVEALKTNRVGCAALDVFEYEPLSLDDELLHLPNVVVTPHISGASTDVAIHHSRMAWEALQAFLNGNTVPYKV